MQEIRPNTFGSGIAGTGIIQLYLKVPINYEQHANKQLGILANEGKDGFSMSKLTGIKVRFSATLPQARVREGLAQLSQQSMADRAMRRWRIRRRERECTVRESVRRCHVLRWAALMRATRGAGRRKEGHLYDLDHQMIL